MHKLTFFPIGNADTTFIEVEGGRLIILDYAHVKNVDDPYDNRCNIESDLRERLKGLNRKDVDVFCITHIDSDHIINACKFFHLDSCNEHQGDDRIKIKELWVPAGAITEEGLSDDARIWRQEARHRLKNGSGIRIFGRPTRLKKYVESLGLTLDQVSHLITDAGELIPSFNLQSDGVEFFVHSPHGHRIDEREVEDRNQDCVVLHAVFTSSGTETKVLLLGDAPWEALEDIAQITKHYGNEDRLEYDICKLPHHCSYLSLSNEKGITKTVPKPDIADWFERGREGAWLIASCKQILAEDDSNPPYIQAKNYYLDVKNAKKGRFLVTMEEPNVQTPKPIEIKIDQYGMSPFQIATGLGSTSIINAKPPQAG